MAIAWRNHSSSGQPVAYSSGALITICKVYPSLLLGTLEDGHGVDPVKAQQSFSPRVTRHGIGPSKTVMDLQIADRTEKGRAENTKGTA
ncbi:hypothetical protein KCU92_g159, partial [Aureobasidium melanogenum]